MANKEEGGGIPKGPYGGTMSVTQSASVSASFTKGASLSATYKSMIAASISSSATLSVSTNASQTGTYTVPANKFGRVAFSPRVLQTTGNFIVEEDRVGGTVVEISRTPVDANFPLKLSNGLADGLYEPIYGNVAF